MAATVTTVTDLPLNTVPTVRIAVRNVTFDNSYPTGGLGLTAAQLGLQSVGAAIATIKTAGANGPVSVAYDVTNSKLKASSATAEVSNATDLSAVTAQVIAIGV